MHSVTHVEINVRLILQSGGWTQHSQVHGTASASHER